MITLLYGEPFPGPWGRLQRDLMASVCLGPSRSLIHMGTRDTSVWITPAKPIKEQTLCQYSLQMSPELSTEDWDEREKPERDCWLTPLVRSKSVHSKGEPQSLVQDSNMSTTAIWKRLLVSTTCFFSTVFKAVSFSLV